MSGSWEESFVATSAALGEPYELAAAAIDASRATELLAALRDERRSARATALAGALAKVARDLDAMGLE